MATGGPTARHPMGNNTPITLVFLPYSCLFHAEQTGVSCGENYSFMPNELSFFAERVFKKRALLPTSRYDSTEFFVPL